MPFAGAFLGGESNTIPAGYGRLELYWTTDDGENQQVTFNLSGAGTYSFQSDENGHISEVIPTGQYTIKVVHDGTYFGDGDKTTTLESKMTNTLMWYAGAISNQTVVFSTPGNLPSATYSIKKGGQVVESGSGWNSSMSFLLLPGDYTLELSCYGDSVTVQFTVDRTQSTTVYLNDYVCGLKLVNNSNFTIISTTYNGYTLASISNTIYVIRTNVSRSINCTISESYEGASTSKVASVSGQSVIPSSAEVNVDLVFTGTVVTITSSESLTIPVAGKYHILAIGGGGGSYTSGGGGGRIKDTTVSLSKTSYQITIGAGGSGGARGGESGGATSFGTLVSASGGDGSSESNDYEAGNGGSGGGGSGDADKGGNGEYGGGGGGGGYSVNSTQNQGGSGGTYGGNGGRGGTQTEDASNGGYGNTPSDKVFYGSSSSSAGSRGGTLRAGGGGGGGYGASGGSGGAAYSTTSGYGGGGGGGGGVAGGSGGKGGHAGTSSSNNENGYGGTGYGAGAGGAGANGRGGGGGGGGLSSSITAGRGYTSGQVYGGSGAKGAVRIQWVSQ